MQGSYIIGSFSEQDQELMTAFCSEVGGMFPFWNQFALLPVLDFLGSRALWWWYCVRADTLQRHMAALLFERSDVASGPDCNDSALSAWPHLWRL